MSHLNVPHQHHNKQKRNEEDEGISSKCLRFTSSIK